MAGNGDQREADISVVLRFGAPLHYSQGPPQLPGHVLDEAGLAAARGPLEEDRQLLAVGRLEKLGLVAHRLVVRLLSEHIFLYKVLLIQRPSAFRHPSMTSL